MARVVSAVDARRTFGELLNRVVIAKEEIIIERAGKRVAKLVSVQDSPACHGALDFRSSAGLGSDFWAGVDVQDLVTKERESWD